MEFFIAQPIHINEFEIRTIQHDFRFYRCTLQDSNNPFELNDFNFMKLLRLPKDTIKMLIETLRPTLKRTQSTGLAVEVLCIKSK